MLQTGQGRQSANMKRGRAEYPSLPPPLHCSQRIGIQHKARVMPVQQQGGGKHELAGEQHTHHLLGEPAGTETPLTLWPRLSAVLPGMSIKSPAGHRKVPRPQQSALGKAGCCGCMTAQLPRGVVHLPCLSRLSQGICALLSFHPDLHR